MPLYSLRISSCRPAPVLHAQPSATTSSLCASGVLGHRRAVDVSRQAQLALPHYSAFIHTCRSRSRIQTQPRESRTHPGRTAFPALPVTRSPTRSLARLLACSLACTHAPTRARNTPAEAAEQKTPIGSVFIYCTSTVFLPARSQPGRPAPASRTCTKHRTTRHPSLATCSYKTAPDAHFLARPAAACRSRN